MCKYLHNQSCLLAGQIVHNIFTVNEGLCGQCLPQNPSPDNIPKCLQEQINDWPNNKLPEPDTADTPETNEESEPPQAPEFEVPSIFTKAQSYALSLSEYISGGFEQVSEEEYQTRLNICKQCDFFKKNKCTVCGCRLGGGSGFTSKLRMKHERCPLEPPKWQ